MSQLIEIIPYRRQLSVYSAVYTIAVDALVPSEASEWVIKFNSLSHGDSG